MSNMPSIKVNNVWLLFDDFGLAKVDEYNLIAETPFSFAYFDGDDKKKLAHVNAVPLKFGEDDKGPFIAYAELNDDWTAPEGVQYGLPVIHLCDIESIIVCPDKRKVVFGPETPAEAK